MKVRTVGKVAGWALAVAVAYKLWPRVVVCVAQVWVVVVVACAVFVWLRDLRRDALERLARITAPEPAAQPEPVVAAEPEPVAEPEPMVVAEESPAVFYPRPDVLEEFDKAELDRAAVGLFADHPDLRGLGK